MPRLRGRRPLLSAAGMIIVACLTLPAAAVATDQPTWTGSQVLSEQTPQRSLTTAAGADGTVLVAWGERAGSDDCRDDGDQPIACVQVAVRIRSAETGQWSAVEHISSPDNDSGDPRAVAGEDGSLTLVWQEDGALLSRTTTTGASGWDAPVTLSGDGEWTGQFDVAVGPDGLTTVAAAGWGYPDGNRVFVRSRDGDGSGWGPAVTVAASGSVWPLSLGFNADGQGALVYGTEVAGTREIVASAFSSESGWAALSTVSSSLSNVDNLEVAVAPDGDALALWTDGSGDFDTGTGDVPARTSLFDRASGQWGPTEQITPDGQLATMTQVVSDSDGNFVYIGQQYSMPGVPMPFPQYRIRDAASGQWSPATSLTGEMFGGAPAVAINTEGDIVAAYITTDEIPEGAPPHLMIAARVRDGDSGDWTEQHMDLGSTYFLSGAPVPVIDTSGDVTVAYFDTVAGAPAAAVIAGDRSAPVIRDVTVPASATTGQSVSLSADAVDTWSPSVSYAWDFGDGTATASGAALAHRWTSGGTYTVTVTATDGGGRSTSEQRTIKVTAPPAPPATAPGSGASPSAPPAPARPPATAPKPSPPKRVELRLSGRRVTVRARVRTRSRKRCAGTATATTRIGGASYRVSLRLRTISGHCTATGTIRLRAVPRKGSTVRVTIRGSRIKTRTVRAQR